MTTELDRNDNLLVSVIIPVYNTAAYLAECLDSVLAQTHGNLEIIVVNDGSTDGSLNIMRDYEKRDPRIIVIDKPNGGYGHSVNKGLERARGHYVAIVEPDDVIGPHMYRDLLSAATREGASRADVVKASYWNYYAPPGEQPWVETPNLTTNMPKTPQPINVHDDCEVLNHHPSIWSAIYRRGFLEEKGIRMIEPKGAGWADNPFFFETLLQAAAIIWVPVAYYYYRQDNPGASSRLKDFHLPFDRLRDIRNIYDRLGITEATLLACLYKREFNYIRTCLEEFRFPESDPELHELIAETLQTMDRKILFNPAYNINRHSLAYYRDFMGKFTNDIKPRDAASKPLFSVLCLFGDDRPYAWEHLKSLIDQSEGSLEILCSVYNSNDRSLDIARECAAIDKRIRILDAEPATFASALEGALADARGSYILLSEPRSFYPRNSLGNLRDHLEKASSADLYRPNTAAKSASDDEADAWLYQSFSAVTDPNISAFDVALAAPYAKRFLCHAPVAATGKALLADLLQQAQSVSNIDPPERGAISYRAAESPLALDEESEDMARTRSTEFDELSRILGSSDIAARAMANYVVGALLADMDSLETASDIQRYFQRMESAVERYGLLKASPLSYDDLDAYNAFIELYSQRGEVFFLHQGENAKRELRKLHNSRGYQLGQRLSGLARKARRALSKKR